MDLEEILQILTYICSIFAFICLSFLMYIFKSNANFSTKFVHKITSQIIFSEILNALTQISQLFVNKFGGQKEYHYYERMRFCYAQIYTSLFTNIHTLTGSALMAYTIYSLLNNNDYLKVPAHQQLMLTLNVVISFLISYLLFIIQMEFYQSDVKGMYRLITCSINKELDWIFFICVLLLFCVITFVYTYKNWRVINKFKIFTLHKDKNENENETIDKEEQTDEEELNKSDESLMRNRISLISKIEKHIYFYPVITLVIYLGLFIHRVLMYVAGYKKGDNGTLINVSSVFYAIPTMVRGVAFFAVFYMFSGKETIYNELKMIGKIILCKGRDYKKQNVNINEVNTEGLDYEKKENDNSSESEEEY